MTGVSVIPQSRAFAGDSKFGSVHVYLFTPSVMTMIMTLSEPGLGLC